MNKGYYAIIPADVRYDARLSPNAKLLYGEITALCNEKGYCWAMNQYFAELYSVKKGAVSKWVGSLRDCGYIECEVQYKSGTKQITDRHIRLSHPIAEKDHTLPSKKTTPYSEKRRYPIAKKDAVNTTVNNTINNTSNIGETSSPKKEIKPKGKHFVEPTLDDVIDYCNLHSYQCEPKAFVDHHSARGWVLSNGKKMVKWQSALSTWERNHKKYEAKNGLKQNNVNKRSEYASNIRDYNKAMRDF